MKHKYKYTVPILAGLALVAACNKDQLACGPSTHEEDGVCVSNDPDTITNTNTNTVTVPNTITNTVPSTQLEPGHYEEVLVEIQELIGTGGALGTGGSGQNHMHISTMDYRPSNGVNFPNALFYCSYTFGVLDATSLNSMSFLAQGFKFLEPVETGTRDPGCFRLTFDDDDPDIVYATMHGNIDDGDAFISGYDLNSTEVPVVPPAIPNPLKVTLAPIQLPMLQEPGEAYEGLDFENGHLFVASHDNGLGVFTRDPVTNVLTRVATYTGLIDAKEVLVDDNVAFVADGFGGFVTLDVSNPENPQALGALPLEGVLFDLAYDAVNHVVYIAAQAGGVHSVDVSDPANPALLGTLALDTAAVSVDYDAGRVFVAAWEDVRVYDAADPANLAIIGAARSTRQRNYSADDGDLGERPDLTNRVLGVSGYGDYVFDGTWWFPKNYVIHAENQAPYIVLPETVNYTTFPGDLAIGESSTVNIEVRNDGNAPLTIFDLWTTEAAFTVSPEQLLIAPGATGTLTVTFTATIGAGTGTSTSGATYQTGEERGFLEIWSDDPSQPVREAYLVGNPDGIAVGDLYTNDATLLDGTPWNFEADALGSVTLVAYFATF